MKKYLLNFSACIIAASLLLSACKKKSDPAPSDDTSQQTADVADENGVSNELDASVNDANSAFSYSSNAGARYPFVKVHLFP